MSRSTLTNVSAALLGLGLALSAPNLGAAEPLSSIGWLSEPLPEPQLGEVMDPEDRARPNPDLPRLRPPSRQRLDAAGLVPPDIAGIAPGLWQASTTADLTAQLARIETPSLPALQALLERLLLISAAPPKTGAAPDGAFLLARIEALLGWGMVDPALALAEAANAATPELALRWLEAGLLAGDAQRVCEAIGLDGLSLLPAAEAVFCQARLGDWSAAQARLDTAGPTIDAALVELITLFLNPDLAEFATPPLPRPLSPLGFRLREAIGAPLNTGPLPPAFAVADLRDVAGFKAQAEAAERLGRLGAISANRWIGIVSIGRPAASGGVWDRVAAVQRFDTALQNDPSAAMAEPLTQARAAMAEAGLEVLFAELYGAKLLVNFDSTAPLPDAVFDIALLSEAYERAARQAPEGPRAAFLAALAQGQPGLVAPPNAMAETLQNAWAATPDMAWRNLLAANRQGEALLEACQMLAPGRAADPRQIITGLSLLRAMGFEQTARRAALQLMLTESGA